jgi:hypothetical protein
LPLIKIYRFACHPAGLATNISANHGVLTFLRRGGQPIRAWAVRTTISSTGAWAVGFFGPTPDQALAFHFK